MADSEAILRRLERLEHELGRQRTRASVWRGLAVVAVLGLLLVPATRGDAAKAKPELMLASPDGRQAARITAQGYEYSFDGEPRAKFDIGETWDRFTLYRQDGSPTFSFGTDDTGASFRMFSEGGKLRIELVENMLESGSGIRLYDDEGNPRATLYSGHRDGETGLRITDGDRQPRVQVSSKPGGVAMVRASDSAATSVAELSVLHRSDAEYRQLGFAAPASENDPLVPMVYMLDPTGTSKLLMPVTPH